MSRSTCPDRLLFIRSRTYSVFSVVLDLGAIQGLCSLEKLIGIILSRAESTLKPTRPTLDEVLPCQRTTNTKPKETTSRQPSTGSDDLAGRSSCGARISLFFFFSLFFFSKKEFFFNFPFLDASCFPLLVSCTRLLWPTGEGRTWTHPASNGILPNSDTHPRAHTYTLTHPLYLFFPSFDSTAIYAERADIERSGGFCIDSPRLLFLTRV